MTDYKFTDRVRHVMRLARESAARLRTPFVAPEHILIGIIDEGHGVANAVLTTLDVPRETLRAALEGSLDSTEKTLPPESPFTSRAKEALDTAAREARTPGPLDHSHVGTEHLLVGILRLEEAPVAQILASHGITFRPSGRRSCVLSVRISEWNLGVDRTPSKHRLAC